jgi:hypothetical protein
MNPMEEDVVFDLIMHAIHPKEVVEILQKWGLDLDDVDVIHALRLNDVVTYVDVEEWEVGHRDWKARD